METVVLQDIGVTLSLEELGRRLHVAEASPQAAELAAMVAAAERIARPKALCGLAYVQDRGEDWVLIDGVRFSSRVLAVNTASAQRVFPYLATSGTEMDTWAAGFDDMLYRFWSEAIREAALRLAMAAVGDYLERTYAPGEMSRMSPGSLPDWPIEQQRPLFQLLGESQSTIGVSLTEGLLMVPSKSVSGIRFPTAETFESCLLCPRPDCPNRRAPHDPALYERRYRRGE
ncbi:MAG: vitamin B12 dependent-methionine synthase activation domain-containing protein [Chloroflexota bacterium]